METLSRSYAPGVFAFPNRYYSCWNDVWIFYNTSYWQFILGVAWERSKILILMTHSLLLKRRKKGSEGIYSQKKKKEKKKSQTIKPHKYLHPTTFDSNHSITDWKHCKQACWHFNISRMVMAVGRTTRLSLKLPFSRYEKHCCVFLSCWQSVLLVIPQSWWCNGVGLSPTAKNAVAPSQPPVLTTISLQILTNLAAQLCVVMPQKNGSAFSFPHYPPFFGLFCSFLEESEGVEQIP